MLAFGVQIAQCRETKVVYDVISCQNPDAVKLTALISICTEPMARDLHESGTTGQSVNQIASLRWRTVTVIITTKISMLHL